MPAKLVLEKQQRTGKFKFTFYAANGKVLAVSESFGTKAAANNAIKVLQQNATTADVEDRTLVAKKATAKKTARTPARKTTAGATAARQVDGGEDHRPRGNQEPGNQEPGNEEHRTQVCVGNHGQEGRHPHKRAPQVGHHAQDDEECVGGWFLSRRTSSRTARQPPSTALNL